ncbi:MAG: hypothetical protein ACE5KZ_00145 [Candidatus Scalinduaceae bacterium]
MEIAKVDLKGLSPGHLIDSHHGKNNKDRENGVEFHLSLLYIYSYTKELKGLKL